MLYRLPTTLTSSLSWTSSVEPLPRWSRGRTLKRLGEDSTPQTLPIWQPLTRPLPPLVPRHRHTPTPITIITAQPLSLQRTQKVVVLSKKMTHKAYTAAAVDHHMLSSCRELERHLFDVFRAFSRNLYNVLCSVHLCACLCVQLVSALCGNVLDTTLGDLLHPRNVSMPTKSPPAQHYRISYIIIII